MIQFKPCNYLDFRDSYQKMDINKYNNLQCKAMWARLKMPKQVGDNRYEIYSPTNIRLNEGESMLVPTGIRFDNLKEDELLLLWPINKNFRTETVGALHLYNEQLVLRIEGPLNLDWNTEFFKAKVVNRNLFDFSEFTRASDLSTITAVLIDKVLDERTVKEENNVLGGWSDFEKVHRFKVKFKEETCEILACRTILNNEGQAVVLSDKDKDSRDWRNHYEF